MKIVTVSMHEMIKAIKADISQNEYWTYICVSAAKLFGTPAVFAVCKLIEEVYPGVAYNSNGWSSGQSDTLRFIEHRTGRARDRDSNDFRKELIGKIRQQPDRQLCWLEQG